jgi:hypothetical protein
MERLKSSDSDAGTIKKGGILNTAFFSPVPKSAVLLLMIPAAAAVLNVEASAPGVYFTADGFAYSETKSIKSIIDNNWDVALQPGDVSFSVDRAEAGVSLGRWQLGYIKRYDYYFEYSPETAEGIYDVKNKVPLVPGEQYDLFLAANTLVSDGLRITFNQEFSQSFSYGVSISYLRGERFTNGSLNGQAEAITDNEYDFSFDVDYFYSQDRLFDRVVDPPRGRGYAVDLVFDWQAVRNLKLGFQAYDILTRMYWDDAPRTIATATSDTKEYDENGYVIYNPVVSGLETSQDYVQKIPRKIFLSADYSIARYVFDMAYRDYEIKSFYIAGVGLNISDTSKIGLSCNLTASACGIDYYNNWFKFRLMTDDLDLQDALALELLLSLSFTF